MKKKTLIGAIVLLVLGLILLIGGCFMLTNRFMAKPLWSFSSEYLTDNFFFVLFGLIGAFFGVMILLLARSTFKRYKEETRTGTPDSMKQHMGMKATSRISNTIIYVVLVIVSVIWLIPFVCIVIQSFRVSPTGIPVTSLRTRKRRSKRVLPSSSGLKTMSVCSRRRSSRNGI